MKVIPGIVDTKFEIFYFIKHLLNMFNSIMYGLLILLNMFNSIMYGLLILD
jgi:hypothetical protein